MAICWTQGCCFFQITLRLKLLICPYRTETLAQSTYVYENNNTPKQTKNKQKQRKQNNTYHTKTNKNPTKTKQQQEEKHAHTKMLLKKGILNTSKNA